MVVEFIITGCCLEVLCINWDAKVCICTEVYYDPFIEP